MSENKSMFIKQKIALKRMELKTKEQASKLHEKAKKIALAVVIMEFLLAGAYWGLVKYEILPLGEKIVAYNTNTAQAMETGLETQPVKPEEVVEWDGIAEMSAYTSRIEECDEFPCISADNTNICEFRGCAVATNDYPFGTKIEIEGLGICVVKDVMAKRYTGTGNMDVYFGMDLKGAKKFGRRNLNYRIIN